MKIMIVVSLALAACKPNNGTCVRPKSEFPSCAVNVRESGCKTGPGIDATFFDDSRAAGAARCLGLGYTDRRTKTADFDIYYRPRPEVREVPLPKPLRIHVNGDGSVSDD